MSHGFQATPLYSGIRVVATVLGKAWGRASASYIPQEQNSTAITKLGPDLSSERQSNNIFLSHGWQGYNALVGEQV